MNATKAIIREAQQGQTQSLMARYRELLMNGSVDQAAELREIAHQLGRYDRMADDRQVLFELSGEADLRAEEDRVSKLMSEAGDRFRKAEDEYRFVVEEAARKVVDAKADSDYAVRQHQLTHTRLRDLDRLRLNNRDLLA